MVTIQLLRFLSWALNWVAELCDLVVPSWSFLCLWPFMLLSFCCCFALSAFVASVFSCPFVLFDCASFWGLQYLYFCSRLHYPLTWCWLPISVGFVSLQILVHVDILGLMWCFLLLFWSCNYIVGNLFISSPNGVPCFEAHQMSRNQLWQSSHNLGQTTYLWNMSSCAYVCINNFRPHFPIAVSAINLSTHKWNLVCVS